jgi:Bacterial Ig-like domain
MTGTTSAIDIGNRSKITHRNSGLEPARVIGGFMRNVLHIGYTALLALVLTACPSSTASKPVIGKFTATPRTVNTDVTDVDLAWTVTGADEIVLSADTPNTVIVLGANKDTATVAGLKKTTVFSLTTKNASGITSLDQKVQVGIAPVISSSTPTLGQSGIGNTAKIVVTFSEAMNQAATVAAYEGNDEISKANSVFSWDQAGTVLTINPTFGLVYANLTDPVAAAKVYSYQFGAGATDLAGNPLDADSQTARTFKTKRNVTQSIDASSALSGSVIPTTVAAVSEYVTNIQVGNSAANAISKGFVGFDLTGVPATLGLDPSQLISASVELRQNAATGTPYATLGTVHLEHISFTGTNLNLEASRTSAYSIAALSDLGVFSDAATVGGRTLSALTTVKSDLTNLTARQNRSTYRLVFTGTDANGITDLANFNPVGAAITNPKLILNYIIP